MDEVHPVVLLLGNTQAPEMHALVQDVRNALPGQSLREAADISTARRMLDADGWFPDLVVALQYWSDEYPARDALELFALVPLARIVCAYGAWCDSDGRNRPTWPNAVRVSAFEASERIAAELKSLRIRTATPAPAINPSLGPPLTQLPRTASRAEVFAATGDQNAAAHRDLGCVAIVSPDQPLRQMLSSALRQAGGNVIDIDAAISPSAILWDADPWNGTTATELAAARRRWPNAIFIAAVALPHPALEVDLRDSGADGVWFKLAPLERLHALLASRRHRNSVIA
jgi:hypothetical protein